MIRTVGELRQALESLPDDLQCILQFERGATMVSGTIDRVFVCKTRSEKYTDYVPVEAVKEIKEDNSDEEFTTLAKPIFVIDGSVTA